MENIKEENKIYDLIVLGGGPAGTAASVYASRKGLNFALITENFGGQAVIAAKIENIPGHPAISGLSMASAFENHLKILSAPVFFEKTKIVKKSESIFEIESESGKKFFSKRILVALGREHKYLDVLGEEKFRGKGVAYCSTCDAPFFKDASVAVVGGGNSALTSVLDLFPYAKKIQVLLRGDKFRADLSLIEKAKADPRVSFVFKAKIFEIFGNDGVEGLRYYDESGNINEIAVSGVFVNIGMNPNSDPIKNLAETNQWGEIKVDPKSGLTSCPGIWAAGDITDLPFKQISIAMGDGVRAILHICQDIFGI